MKQSSTFSFYDFEKVINVCDFSPQDFSCAVETSLLRHNQDRNVQLSEEAVRQPSRRCVLTISASIFILTCFSHSALKGDWLVNNQLHYIGVELQGSDCKLLHTLCVILYLHGWSDWFPLMFSLQAKFGLLVSTAVGLWNCLPELRNNRII